MALTVHKFGGAALRDGPALQHAARTLAAEPGARVCVVSALAGVTDSIAALWARAAEDGAHVALGLAQLGQQHRAALAACAPADAAAQGALDEALLRLERLLLGASEDAASPRLRDLVHSFGERLAAILVAAAVRAVGTPAVALDAEHAGIRTLGPYGACDPDTPRLRAECPTRLKPLLDAGTLPIVTGYYGIDSHGHATLFGRGGSDFVAALVADALHADAVHLWKDVPGFLSADPRLVPEAHLLRNVSYDEAAELSQFGARVLHARAVEPVQAAGIPIRIRSVSDPRAAGSTVSARGAGPGVHAVSCLDGVAVVRLSGAGLAAQAGIAQRVFAALPANVLLVANSQTTLSLAVAEDDAPRAVAALRTLGGTVRDVTLASGMSLVCVVGMGVAAAEATARMLAALAQAKAPLEMASLPGNRVALDVVVPTRLAATCVRLLHERLDAPLLEAAA